MQCKAQQVDRGAQSPGPGEPSLFEQFPVIEEGPLGAGDAQLYRTIRETIRQLPVDAERFVDIASPVMAADAIPDQRFGNELLPLEFGKGEAAQHLGALESPFFSYHPITVPDGQGVRINGLLGQTTPDDLSGFQPAKRCYGGKSMPLSRRDCLPVALEPLQRLRHTGIIAVQGKEEVPMGFFHPPVKRSVLAAILLPEIANRKIRRFPPTSYHLGRSIGRPVVDDQPFEIPTGLHLKGLKNHLQRRRPIEGRGKDCEYRLSIQFFPQFCGQLPAGPAEGSGIFGWVQRPGKGSGGPN